VLPGVEEHLAGDGRGRPVAAEEANLVGVGPGVEVAGDEGRERGVAAVRCRQVTALAEFIARHRGDTPFPPLVTGDFNAWPDSDEIRLFGGHRTAPPVPGQVFLDAWEYADPTAPSATWDAANPYVAKGGMPSARIDYLHIGMGGPVRVRGVRRAGDVPVDGVWPSDHAAVVADLSVS
ncbi:endonuclease/exonuclease/phosphatase family protein, partial [Streptomyces bobili]|uniref:endonuclease/exonuclease/phosphatase family protein n=1 Tax=Streptomyces bobili TaxID=67280 RepID=UPI0031343985